MSSWLTLPKGTRTADAAVRLLCFHHAGGAASAFRAFAPHLPPSIALLPVQLPGREQRIGELPFDRLAPLVDAIGRGLSSSLAEGPFAMFGHSFGALVAFEVARRCFAEGGATPLALFVSGHRAPRIPAPGPPLHDLPDAAFVEELRRRNGTPAEVLASRELMELLLRPLRADYAAAETYRYQPGPPLPIPLFAFGGAADPETTAESLDAWRAETRGPFTRAFFDGDHFFPFTAAASTVAAITAGIVRANS